jgi:ATP adenylyltransferase
MKNLWSPWRSQYIDSFKDESTKNSCIFCEAAKQDVNNSPNLLVKKSSLTFTMLNLYPYNNGHLMIIPFKHTGEFSDLTEDELLEIMKEISTAKDALADIYNPHGFNIGANIGRVSGAGIDDHIHFHIVPRWSGDTNFMPVLGEVKIISQDLLETKKKLLNYFQSK